MEAVRNRFHDDRLDQVEVEVHMRLLLASTQHRAEVLLRHSLCAATTLISRSPRHNMTRLTGALQIRISVNRRLSLGRDVTTAYVASRTLTKDAY